MVRNMIKSLYKSLLIAFISFLIINQNSYADGIKVSLNGNFIEYNFQPINNSGTVLIPLRETFEFMNANVEWIDAEKLILITKNSKLIALKINSNIMILNDISVSTQKSVTLSQSPQIINDKTYIPLRAVAESLNYQVEWDGENQHVIILS